MLFSGYGRDRESGGVTDVSDVPISCGPSVQPVCDVWITHGYFHGSGVVVSWWREVSFPLQFRQKLPLPKNSLFFGC